MRLNNKTVFVPLLISILIFSGFAARKLSTVGPVEQTAKSRVSLKPCRIPNVEVEAKCGTYEVFEDRVAKTGRKISLNIIVVPALSSTPAPDPVFWLHGGPGAAATTTAPAVQIGFLSGVHKNHDVVFVDQRGTGNSNGLKCDIGDDPADLKKYYGVLEFE